ncbi:hypothetical protein AaE_014862 [Aphanomyces astaci]|uniref:Uncharacterized protein n=1 Tax=Aphanomyces astaci TaxID=112090 RepID=A0A6A4YY66_APHAT|nr:hypothetical protein AaE_014862 [Aphanomyces astaci]
MPDNPGKSTLAHVKALHPPLVRPDNSQWHYVQAIEVKCVAKEFTLPASMPFFSAEAAAFYETNPNAWDTIGLHIIFLAISNDVP